MRTSRLAYLSSAIVTLTALGACYHQPPLIEDATIDNNPISVCPTLTSESRARSGLSPVFDGRLRRGFPPGTPETKLVAVLNSQGFQSQPSCTNEPSIHSAQWGQGGDRMPMVAVAAWKVDDHSRIVWTRGYLAHSEWADQ